MMRRLAQIVAVALRYQLDELLLGRARELGIAWLLPSRWRSPPEQSLGRRLREAFDALGPVFVKLGQLLSVRPDLIPEPIAAELAALRDQVHPLPSEVVVEVLREAYGRAPSEVFASFDPEPLASASIAQVHRATLEDGTAVVVKVVRPDIEAIIDRDVRILDRLARILEIGWPGLRRFQPRAVVQEYDAIIHHELDMFREAASASLLRRNFSTGELLVVPQVHWDYVRPQVLVLDEIAGIPVDQVQRLRAAAIDLERLAESGVAIFFKQVFEDNFFHADMHPGNIFVALDADQNPVYQAVDFGIMGSLGPEDQRYLAENFLAFFRRDYRRVAQLHVSSGWVGAGTRVEEFEAEIRSLCEPVFERPLAEISFASLLVRLFRTARRFDMPVQPQLVLLQKTLLHIEGIGRQLYPELDLWRTAKPFFERWMARRAGPRAVLDSLDSSVGQWSALFAELGPELPDRIRQALVPPNQGPTSALPRRSGGPGWGAILAGIGLIALGLAPVVGWLLLGAGLGWLAARR